MCEELSKLNEILENEKKGLDIYIVGGYFGLRSANKDIDAYYADFDSVNEFIDEFNKNSKLNLNNEVMYINDEVYRFNKDHFHLYCKMSNLNVFVPYTDYFVIMKIVACSLYGNKNFNKHLNDLKLLAKYMGFENNYSIIYNFFKKYNLNSYGIQPIIDYLEEN